MGLKKRDGSPMTADDLARSETVAEARMGPAGLEVRKAAYCRSAQILLRGHVPLHRASEALKRALRAD